MSADPGASEFERGRRAGAREQADREANEWRTKMEKRMGEVERELGGLRSDFKQFVAVQTAKAAQAVSTRTFVLGVAAILVTVVSVLLSQGAH